MSLRIVLVSDTFAYAFLNRRPYPAWEPYWKGYRDRAIITPEYGLLYIAGVLKQRGIPFDLVNIVADRWNDVRWFEVSDEHQHNEAARAELDGLIDGMREDLCARLTDADVVMVPMSYYYMVRGVKRMIARMRAAAPNAMFVVGGNYATMHADQVIAEGLADVVVRGEGEDVVVGLVEEIRAGKHLTGILDTRGITYRLPGGDPRSNPDMPRIDDLDRLPHMYFAGDEFRVGMRHRFLKALQPDGDYFIGSSYVTSRGCPERCTFCMDPTIWNRKVRFHSPEYVQDVVRFCWDNYHTAGKPKFYFGDATFTLRKARLYDICDRIGKIGWTYNVQTRADMVDEETLLRMKAANFTSLAFGSESFNDEILESVVLKRQTSEQILRGATMARDLGLDPILTFIAGLPGEPKESHLRTVSILREHGFSEATFFPLVVFNGTPLYDQFVANRSHQDIELARFDEDSEEYCCLSEDFPTKEALISWAGYLNGEVRKAASPGDDLSGSTTGHLLAG
ncbi:MAG: radical SAM protein [Actinomycetota bacterium]